MKKLTLLSLLTLILSSAASGTEQRTTLNYQYVSGDCNLVFNSQTGEAPPVPTQNNCPGLSSSKSVADSLRKIERFIEASNPTEVTLSDAGLIHWAGDQEEFLTLSLFNSSGLPAENVKVRMLDVVRPNEKNSRPLSFYPSKAFPKSLIKNLSIARNRTTQIAVASATEIESVSIHRVPSGYRFIGAGISPNQSDTIKKEFRQKTGLPNIDHVEVQIIGLGVELSYKNIFGAKNTTLTAIYLYYGKLPHA
nr:hypothetical protein [uncultured Pseudomonas sp.]